MAGKQVYSLDTFRDLVKAKKSKKEIMSEMTIKNQTTFTALHNKLMVTDNKVYQILGGGSDKARNVVKMGKRGTISLSANLLQDSGFETGNDFKVSIKANKISLTLIEDTPSKD